MPNKVILIGCGNVGTSYAYAIIRQECKNNHAKQSWNKHQINPVVVSYIRLKGTFTNLFFWGLLANHNMPP